MRRAAARAVAAAGAGALSLLALGATASPDLFRFSRPVTAAPGWARLVLPDDVLDACRPGLPDLRLYDASGREVPWALEERVASAPARFAFRNVERLPGVETTAIVDRGARPALARSAMLAVDGEEYMKPVSIESSDDARTWRPFAKGSVFSTRLATSTTLRFAANDRRWWRFRFDDRNGDPVAPREVVVAGEEPEAGITREIPLALSAAAGGSVLTATLPAANLGVVAIRLEASSPAYSRDVRVSERIFFRGEVSRRLIGEGVISRAPDGSGNDRIALGDGSGRTLEIEVEKLDGPPLEIARVFAVAPARAILFSAPEGGARLAYGSALADAPRYDVGRALSISKPGRFAQASAGAPSATAGTASQAALPGVPRGAVLDPAQWKWRQPLELPAAGNVAYLDLAGPAAAVGGAPRIVDSANRQVPYVVERAAHRERRPVEVKVSVRGTRTVAELSALPDMTEVDAIEISATAPAFFSRQVVVLEQEMDARGAAQTRTLGAASWEKRPDDPTVPLTVPIGRPTTGTIRVEIENGDNEALAIGPCAVWTSTPRIDFVFQPGEKLALVSGNAEVAPPRYDLELVAARVLAAPALPARITAAPAATAPVRRGTPAWLWVAVAAAAALVALVLVRTLKGG